MGIIPVVVVAILTLGAHTRAQEPQRAVAQEVMAISGVVEEIDYAGRMVTIRAGNTLQAPIYAGPDMPIFAQLMRGDVVTIRYYDAVVVELTPGARLSTPRDTTAEAQQKLTRPDAAVVQQVSMVVTVDAVDAAAWTVTYHGADNRRVMRQVRHPNLIAGLKVGDVVTVRQTRARAVSIEKQP